MARNHNPSPSNNQKILHLRWVRGSWDEEETCLKASPLTLTGVTKGHRNKRQKDMVKVEEEIEPVEENGNSEMETIPEKIPRA